MSVHIPLHFLRAHPRALSTRWRSPLFPLVFAALRVLSLLLCVQLVSAATGVTFTPATDSATLLADCSAAGLDCYFPFALDTAASNPTPLLCSGSNQCEVAGSNSGSLSTSDTQLADSLYYEVANVSTVSSSDGQHVLSLFYCHWDVVAAILPAQPTQCIGQEAASAGNEASAYYEVLSLSVDLLNQVYVWVVQTETSQVPAVSLTPGPTHTTGGRVLLDLSSLNDTVVQLYVEAFDVDAQAVITTNLQTETPALYERFNVTADQVVLSSDKGACSTPNTTLMSVSATQLYRICAQLAEGREFYFQQPGGIVDALSAAFAKSAATSAVTAVSSGSTQQPYQTVTWNQAKGAAIAAQRITQLAISGITSARQSTADSGEQFMGLAADAALDTLTRAADSTDLTNAVSALRSNLSSHGMEWVRLASYALGGLNVTLASNGKQARGYQPQLVKTTVLGTWETNSAMFQLEQFTAAVLALCTNYDVQVSVARVPFDGQTGPLPGWLTAAVDYSVNFIPTPPSAQTASSNSRCAFPNLVRRFFLYDTWAPLMLESHMDFLLLNSYYQNLMAETDTAIALTDTQQQVIDYATTAGSTVSSLTGYTSPILSSYLPFLQSTSLGSLSIPGLSLVSGNTSVQSGSVVPSLGLSLSLSFSDPVVSSLTGRLSSALSSLGSIDASLLVFPYQDVSLLSAAALLLGGNSAYFAPSNVEFSVSLSPSIPLVTGFTLDEALLILRTSVSISLSQTTAASNEGVALTASNKSSSLSLNPTPVVCTLAGTFSLQLPGDSSPVELDTSVTVVEGVSAVYLSALLLQWTDPFGLNGLTLDYLQLDAALQSNPVFDLTTQLTTSGGTVLTLAGEYDSASDFVGLTVLATDLTLADLQDVFNEAFHTSFSTPDFQLIFNEMSISLANQDGTVAGVPVATGLSVYVDMSVLEVGLYNLTVFGQFSPDGVILAATVPELPWSVDGLSFYDIAVIVELGVQSGSGTGRTSSILFTANATANALSSIPSFDVTVYLQFAPKAAFLLIGSIDDIVLSRYIPALAGTFFDPTVTLTFSFSACASSSSGCGYSALPPGLPAEFSYLSSLPTVSGDSLTITAIIDNVPFVDLLFGQSIVGILAVELSSGSDIIDITFDAPSISLGPLEGGSLSAFVELVPEFAFGFQLELMLDLPGNQLPSILAAKLKVDPVSIELSASIADQDPDVPAWPNAFGITGLDVFNLGILAAINTETGLPDELGFTGEIELVDHTGKQYIIEVAVVIGADPGNELLQMEEYNIDFGFFVALANALCNQCLGAVGDEVAQIVDQFDVLAINYLFVSFSDGASIGNIQYPVGGSLTINASLFDSIPLFEVSGFIDVNGGISITGELYGFSIGPLQLTSTTGGNPTFGLVLTSQEQRFYLNGEVVIGNQVVFAAYALITTTSLDLMLNVTLNPQLYLFIEILGQQDPSNPNLDDFTVQLSADVDGIKQLILQVIQLLVEGFDAVINDAQGAFSTADQYVQSGLADLSSQFLQKSNVVGDAQTALADVQQAQTYLTDLAYNAYTSAVNGIYDAYDQGQQLLDNAEANGAQLISDAESAYQEIVNYWNDAINTATDYVNNLENQLSDAENEVSNLAQEVENELESIADDIGGWFSSWAVNDTASNEINNRRFTVMSKTDGGGLEAAHSRRSSASRPASGRRAAADVAKADFSAVRGAAALQSDINERMSLIARAFGQKTAVTILDDAELPATSPLFNVSSAYSAVGLLTHSALISSSHKDVDATRQWQRRSRSLEQQRRKERSPHHFMTLDLSSDLSWAESVVSDIEGEIADAQSVLANAVSVGDSAISAAADAIQSAQDQATNLYNDAVASGQTLIQQAEDVESFAINAYYSAAMEASTLINDASNAYYTATSDLTSFTNELPNLATPFETAYSDASNTLSNALGTIRPWLDALANNPEDVVQINGIQLAASLPDLANLAEIQVTLDLLLLSQYQVSWTLSVILYEKGSNFADLLKANLEQLPGLGQLVSLL